MKAIFSVPEVSFTFSAKPAEANNGTNKTRPGMNQSIFFLQKLIKRTSKEADISQIIPMISNPEHF